MPKFSLKRILQLRIITCLISALCLIVTIQFFSLYGEYDYAHIPEEKIQEELYRATVPYLVKKSKVECKYEEVLTSSRSLTSREALRGGLQEFHARDIANGSHAPEHCRPAFSVAILVTYRNRQEQLNVFPQYMHNFLRKQNIHYKIYLIEQQDEKPWNKGLLYNVGAKRAIADQFPCLVLHDVDLLPLDRSNLYACTRSPRHMSASLDKFRYVLPYERLVGGVLAVRADQFVLVDGFSNRFLGWGGEDDDFARRLADHRLPVVRFPRTMSRYTMVRHAPAPRNPDRLRILQENRRHAGDGYAALPPGLRLAVRHHTLFTLIQVRT